MRLLGLRILAAACLLAAVRELAGQSAPADSPASPRLEILEPTSADTPVGTTRIRVFARGAEPGDAMDFFVDGSLVGRVSREPWQVEWPAGETVRRHVITVSLLRAGREVATARVDTREPGFTARAAARVVGLAPVVTDRSGRYILGLQRADFRVLDDGRPQRIETFDAEDSPLAAILVLDVSASMQPKLDEAVRAARAFVSAAKPDDRLGLITFNSGIVESVPLGTDRSRLLAALEAARAEGDTALYDAIAAALRRLKSAPQRKALVVFTDGDDNRSRFSVSQVTEMARQSEVCVYAIAEGVSDPELARFLQRIARDTGGRFDPIEQIGKLDEVFAAIVKELRSQYFLTYTPSNRKPRTWHSVDVRVNRVGAVVKTKKRYYLP